MQIMGPSDYARMGGMGRRGIGGLRGQFNRSRAMGRPAHPTPPPGVNFDLPSRPMGGMMNPMATPGVFKPMGGMGGMPQPGYTPPPPTLGMMTTDRMRNTAQPAPFLGDRRRELETQRQRRMREQAPLINQAPQFDPRMIQRTDMPSGLTELPGYAPPLSPPPSPQQFDAGPQVSLLAPQGPAPFQNISRPLGQPQPLGGPGQQMLGGPQQQGGGQAQGGAKWTMEIKPAEGMATGGMIEEGGVDVPASRIPEAMTDGVEVLNFDSTAPLPELENPNTMVGADMPVIDMNQMDQMMDLMDGGMPQEETASSLMESELLGEQEGGLMQMGGIGGLNMMGGGYVPMVYANGGLIPAYGFGSFLKKAAKGALKLAPVAAMAIPGIGPLASAGIGGLAGTLGSKLDGGDWGSALSRGMTTGIKSYAGKKALDKFTEGFGGGEEGASFLEKLEGGLGGLKDAFSKEDLARLGPMLLAGEAMEQGHAGGGGGDMTATTLMPDSGGGQRGRAGQVGTIMGNTGRSTADVYNLFDKAGGGSLYAMRRFGGGPIKGYQEGGEFGDEFDEPMYRPPPRRRTARRRPSRAQQEAARRREAEMRRQRERAAAERAEEARMAEDIEPALPAKIAAMPPPPLPPAPVEAPPENIEPVAPPTIATPPERVEGLPTPPPIAPLSPPRPPIEAPPENIEPALPATFAAMPPPPPPPPVMEPVIDEPMEEDMALRPPPVAPPPPRPPMPPPVMEDDIEVEDEFARPDVPVGTPPLGTLDDQFIDEVEQVLPTTTRSIPATDVSRFGPEVMPEPSEIGEGEGEEGALTDADPGAYGTPLPRDAATTYPTGLSFEEEVERQVKQAQTEAEEEGEPDEEGVFEDDPMAEKARDLGVTPSGKLDETGDVVRDEEYIAAQGPYMGHGYEQPAPPAEAPTMAAPGEGEGLGLVDAPTGQQEPMNIFGAGADPFNMPTRADQFEDPRMQAMLNRLNTDPAPLRTMTPGKAEGGLIQEMQQDELGAEILSRVVQALQDPTDAQNAETLASFQEAFGEEALQELVQTLQQGMAAEEQPMAMQTGGLIPGTGDAMADDRFGVVDAGQPDAYPIKFSSGEFIVAGDVVAGLGSGSTDRGAEVLNNLQDDVRMARNGTTQQAPPIDLSEVLPGTYGEKYE